MDEFDETFRTVKAGLETLAQLQQIYDADLWAIKKPDFAKFRHITHHVHMVAGELTRFCERWEHQIANAEVTSDNIDVATTKTELQFYIGELLMYAVQFANMADLSPNQSYLEMCKRNAGKFAPNSRFAQLVAAYSLPTAENSWGSDLSSNYLVAEDNHDEND